MGSFKKRTKSDQFGMAHIIDGHRTLYTFDLAIPNGKAGVASSCGAGRLVI